MHAFDIAPTSPATRRARSHLTRCPVLLGALTLCVLAGCDETPLPDAGSSLDAGVDADTRADAGSSTEPNDTADDATPLDAVVEGSTEVSGRVGAAGDTDWYVLTLQAGQTVEAELRYDIEAAVLALELRAPDAEWVAERPRWGDEGVAIAPAPITETGRWYLRVDGRADDVDVPYTLEVRVSSASGEVRFISPSGDDAASGLEGAAWRTWPRALGALGAGDMLIVGEGTWTVDPGCREGDPLPCETDVAPSTGTTVVAIQCASGSRVCDGEPCAMGTTAAPISVVAARERRSLIAANGHTAIGVTDCERWILQGLRVRSADNPSIRGGGGIAVSRSTDVTIRRALSRFPNRYQNAHALSASGSVGSVIEESEVYSFRRHGVMCFGGSECTIRACYAHSRAHATPADCGTFPETFCTDSGSAMGGDEGVSLYLDDNSVLENNVSDSNSQIQISGVDGVVVGNINIDHIASGFLPATHPRDYGRLSTGTLLENDVDIRSNGIGIFPRSAADLTIRNVSVFDSAMAALAADNHNSCEHNVASCDREPAFVTPAIDLANALLVGPAGSGFSVRHRTEFASVRIEAINTFDVGGSDIVGTLDGDIISSTTLDPALGGCLVYVPDTSPMRGAGVGGADIGANVIFRYEDGIETRTRLWDQRTGSFPCGAIVPGVNDVPGESCFDIHERLNVGTGGCAIPTGVGR